MRPSRASGIESCNVSSSLPTPARIRHDIHPSSPADVSSSTAPPFGQVCCEGACICLRSRFCLFYPPPGNDKITLESLRRVHGELANLQCFPANCPYGGRNRRQIAV